jgi:hypothetical protein
MRVIQIIFFALGFVAFLLAAYHHDSYNGETFWKVGVAFMLSDAVLLLLCPAKPKAKDTPATPPVR